MPKEWLIAGAKLGNGAAVKATGAKPAGAAKKGT